VILLFCPFLTGMGGVVQSVAPGGIRAEVVCFRVDLLDFGVIHACEWSL